MTGKEGHIPGESEAVAMINYDSEPSLRDLQGLMTVSRPGRLSDSDDHRHWNHVVLVSDKVSDWLSSPGPGPLTARVGVRRSVPVSGPEATGGRPPATTVTAGSAGPATDGE